MGVEPGLGVSSSPHGLGSRGGWVPGHRSQQATAPACPDSHPQCLGRPGHTSTLPLKPPTQGQRLPACGLSAHPPGRARGKAAPQDGDPSGLGGALPLIPAAPGASKPQSKVGSVCLGINPPGAISPTGLRLADAGHCRPVSKGGSYK